VEGREISVHLALFPRPEEVFASDPRPVLEEWKQLFAVRDEVMRMLETARQSKEIGKGLEAKVILLCGPEAIGILEKYSGSLKEFFNVSDVELRRALTETIGASQYSVESLAGRQFLAVIEPASGTKCARCWNFMPEVSNYGVWQNVCTRCQSALREMNVAPPQAENAGAVA
jgi:isoleucyl-tRNA synthetase